MTGGNIRKDEDSEQQVKSGPWSGYYRYPPHWVMDPDARTQCPMDLIMDVKFGGSRFWGFGTDEEGHFLFKYGQFSGTMMTFVKKYMYSTHNIYYIGDVMPDQTVTGHWRYSPHGPDEGVFALEPGKGPGPL